MLVAANVENLPALVERVEPLAEAEERFVRRAGKRDAHPSRALPIGQPLDRLDAGQGGDFLQAGTRPVWVVFPETQTVDVYWPAQDVRAVDAQGVLQGEDVLPGFELPLRTLFESTQGRGKRLTWQVVG